MLTLERQAPGRVATGVPIFKSLVWLNPVQSRRKRDSNPRSSAPEADALTTMPARRFSCRSTGRQQGRHLTRVLPVCLTIIVIIVMTLKDANRDFVQSPYCIATCQHISASGPGSVVRESLVTHQALVTCTMPCNTWYEGTTGFKKCHILLLLRSTAVQVMSSVRLMPQNQPSGRGLLPSPTAWPPDQHLAATLADVSRYILGRTEGRGLGFGQLARTHTGKCLKCQSSSDGHSDDNALWASGR